MPPGSQFRLRLVTMVPSPEEAVRPCAIKGVQRRQRDGIHRCKGNDDELDIYMTKDFHDINEFLLCELFCGCRLR